MTGALLVITGCSSAIPPKASVTPVAPLATSAPTTSTVAPTPATTLDEAFTAATTVESQFGDFQLSIPSDWILLTPSAEELTSLGDKVSGALAGVSGSALIDDAESIEASTAFWASSPGPSAFRENLQVIRLDRMPNVTLETLEETAIGQLTALGLVDITTADESVNALDGVRISSRTADGTNPRLFQTSVFLVGIDHVWVMNFAADDEAELETFNHILDSFQLLIPSS